MPIAHYRVIAATSIRARAREQPVPDTPRSGSLLARLAESARKSAQRTHRYLPSGGARLSRKAHTLRARATVYTPRDDSRARSRALLRFRFPVPCFRFRFLAGEREGVTRLGARDTRNENAHGIDTVCRKRRVFVWTRDNNGGTIRRVYVRNRTARARRLPPPTGWPRSRAEPTERPRSCPIAVGRCYVRQAASE